MFTIEQPATVAKICLGITPGYFHDNPDTDFELLCKKIQEILEISAAECRVYISFTITRAKCVYKTDWGCPEGGENVVLLEATRNSTYNNDENVWKIGVQSAANKLKECFGQATLTISFNPATVVYLR